MTLQENLIFINSNFNSLVETIEILESKNMKLTDSVNLIENLFHLFENLRSENGKQVFDKMKKVIEKNKGFREIQLISRILNGEKNIINNLRIKYSVNEVTCFNYASITSCEVERSFSKYKSFLNDHRHNFTNENLQMTFVIYCNNDNSDH